MFAVALVLHTCLPRHLPFLLSCLFTYEGTENIHSGLVDSTVLLLVCHLLTEHGAWFALFHTDTGDTIHATMHAIPIHHSINCLLGEERNRNRKDGSETDRRTGQDGGGG